MKVWKVVCAKTLASAVMYAPVRVYYRPEVPAFRPDGCGPLCAFDSLKAAKKWAGMWAIGTMRIFEARAKKSKAKRIWDGSGCEILLHQLFPGTVLCDKITLLKEVTE